MAARRLDGKELSKTLQAEIKDEVTSFVEQNGITPCLCAVLVGEDPASEVYIKHKRRACERAGIESRLHQLSADTSQEELEQLIDTLNQDDSVHGILVQLPLPPALDTTKILDSISAQKDVDAFHPENVGRISQGRPRFLPCTPHGIQQILYRYDIEVTGKHVVIVGRSDIVGKPMAMMLAAKSSPSGPQWANATVTVCHSRTSDMTKVCRQADILIVAIGQAKMVTGEMIKPGATVIDVGINRTDDGLVGDVDFESVEQVAGDITPVPGGVGPLTVTMLLHNTLAAAKLQT